MIRATIFLLFFITTGLQAQTINQKIEEMMQKHVELNQFSGTVLLAKEGKVLYAKAFGEANKSFGIKNDLDTKFNIASMGKMFTGVSILQLEERGRLNINDPVVKYLEDFPLGDQITLFHLLSHTSGVGSYMRDPDYRSDRHRYKTIDDLTPIIYKQKLEFETPGEKFSYSNSGMVLLGAVIEKITNQSYSEYITENILEPVHMTNTVMKFGDEVVENWATGYMKSISGKYHNNYFKRSSPYPDGGILSTVGDMLKFDQALYSSILVNNVSKQKMFTALKVTYGLAFQVEDRQGNRVVGHSGGMPGISSYFSRYLDDKYTIIALSNYDMISKNIVHYIEDILYDVKYTLPKERLGPFMYKNKAKIEALATLQDITDYITQNGYSIRHPQHLNQIAYEFLNEKEMDFAIKFFSLNAHLFPEDANVYDSLGEAYENNLQNDLALMNYERAVEIGEKYSHRSLNSFRATLARFKEKLNNGL